jgi:hypothetical protein
MLNNIREQVILQICSIYVLIFVFWYLYKYNNFMFCSVSYPTALSRVRLGKFIVTRLDKKFQDFYWTRMFITVSQEPATLLYTSHST